MRRLRETPSVGGSWPSPRDQSQLAQLAMLPDAALSWVDRPASAIAEDLTELLSRAFPVESVHVHLASGDGAPVRPPQPPARSDRLVQMQIGSAGEWGSITFVRRRNDFPTPLDVALIRTLAGQVVAALRYAQLATRYENTTRLLAALSTEQQVITQLGRRFMTLSRVDEMLAASLSDVRQVMHADFCEIYEVTPDGGSIELRATEGWPSPPAATRSLIQGDDCEVSFALRSAEPLVIGDYRAEQRFQHWAVPPELGARCGASAAISGHRGAFGVLSVHSCALREFTPDQLTFQASVALLLGSAIEHRRAENERETLLARATAAQEAAEVVSEAKTRFLGMMSHELRSPLNAIGGYVEILKEGIRGPVTREQREDLARVARNQRYLLGLIENVLSYLKLDNGRIPYQMELVPIDELLAAVNDTVAPLVEAKSLHYESVTAVPGLTVRADRSKLQQIIVNLLSNAVKFTPVGGRVKVLCQSGETTFRIHVCDSGVGVAAARLPQLFEPFAQDEQKSGVAHGSGTGLGLSISREFAAGMGGHLVACSERGRGSIFTILLPRSND